nr:hypothetical protein [Tanacetum cinerariifolium]
MSSASSAFTYTSVYTNSEPGRVFWGADEELSDEGSPRVIAAISLPPEAEVERLLAMPTPPPSPIASLSPPYAGERLARCTAPSACPSPPPISSPLLPSFGYPTQNQTLRMAY